MSGACLPTRRLRISNSSGLTRSATVSPPGSFTSPYFSAACSSTASTCLMTFSPSCRIRSAIYSLPYSAPNCFASSGCLRHSSIRPRRLFRKRASDKVAVACTPLCGFFAAAARRDISYSLQKPYEMQVVNAYGDLSFLLRECIQFALGAEVESIVRDSRCCRYTFAEFWIPDDKFRLGRPGFQDRHGPIVQRRKINMAIRRHRRGIVTTRSGDPFLDINFLACFRVVGTNQATVLDHDHLAAVNNRGRNERQPLGLLPKDMRTRNVACPAGRKGKGTTLGLGDYFAHPVPLLARDLAVFVCI